MLKTFFSALCAGVLIAIGGCVYLACDNRYAGAVLFSIALLCICYQQHVLFTGRVCYVLGAHTGRDLAALFIGLAGNLTATGLFGPLVRYAIPSSGTAADALCAAKLAGQTLPQTFLRAVLCGVVIYLAVSIFKDNKTPLSILYGIPVFILSGFEHSIADMFYFSASDAFIKDAGRSALFLLTVVAGNAVGGVLLPLLQLPGTRAKKGGKAA